MTTVYLLSTRIIRKLFRLLFYLLTVVIMVIKRKVLTPNKSLKLRGIRVQGKLTIPGDVALSLSVSYCKKLLD